ncbi:MAG: prepilin-type N-terminal cleavage/methylation domain-containing protein [Opitutae bacterium]
MIGSPLERGGAPRRGVLAFKAHLNPASARGFTLLEVLVSLAIFALAAVILAAAYVNTLTAFDAAARQQGRQQDLTWVRAGILAEPERKVVEEGGELVLPDDRRVRWEAEITPTGVADLFQVTLHCTFTGSGRAGAWTQDSQLMVLRPTWSESDAREKLRAAARAKLAEERKS